MAKILYPTANFKKRGKDRKKRKNRSPSLLRSALRGAAITGGTTLGAGVLAGAGIGTYIGASDKHRRPFLGAIVGGTGGGIASSRILPYALATGALAGVVGHKIGERLKNKNSRSPKNFIKRLG